MELHCLMVSQRIPKIIRTESKPERNQKDFLYVYVFWLCIGHTSWHPAVSQIFLSQQELAAAGTVVETPVLLAEGTWCQQKHRSLPVPSQSSLTQNLLKSPKMFLNCFSYFGWILNLPPLPPHQKPQHFEHLGEGVHAGYLSTDTVMPNWTVQSLEGKEMISCWGLANNSRNWDLLDISNFLSVFWGGTSVALSKSPKYSFHNKHMFPFILFEA